MYRRMFHVSTLAKRQLQRNLAAPTRSFSSSVPDKPDKDIISKSDIVKEVAEMHDLTYAKSERIVNSVFDSIVEAVSQDRVVRLSQFGSFERCQSDARMGRNPHNGEAIQIPAKKRVRFKPYDAYKKSVNGGP